MSTINAPGLSIFQGGESLKLDTSHDRLEEEEALEDQRRRNEELKNQLQNAFDDLIEDEDNTIDSSNFQSNLTNGHGTGGGGAIPDKYDSNGNMDNHQQYNHQVFEQIERMKMELDSKNREIENISKIAHEERKNNEDLKKRLALADAERERSNMTKSQTHELLVDSKAKCSELEDVISKLKGKIKSLEMTNNDLVGQVERTQTMLADAQHKYHIVEKNTNFANDRNADMWKKQFEDRQRAQIEMMQQQIDSIRNRYEEKEMELKNLDTRYKELQRSREQLMLDKAETINQLAKSLEDSQRQCQKLMTKQDYSHENVRLHRLVADLERQAEDMQKTIDGLRARLETTTAELELMDSVLLENIEIDTTRRLSATKGHFTGSTPITSTDRLGRLKDELYRCMAGQKEKRDEIRRLKEQLDCKIEQITSLREEENKSLVLITTCKEENIRLKSKLKVLEEELDEAKSKRQDRSRRSSMGNHLDELKKENIRLTEELAICKRKVKELEEKLSVNDDMERQKIDSKLKNLNIDLEELKQEHDSLKLNYENVVRENDLLKQRTSDPNRLELEKLKFLLKDSQNECDRYKNLYIEISDSKEAIALELANLNNSDIFKDLHEQRTKAVSLDRALQLAELKSTELSKILTQQKSNHEQQILKLKERFEKEKEDGFKAVKNASNRCSKCLEYIAEVTKLEIDNLKTANHNASYLKEINNLHEQLSEAKQAIDELNDKIGLKDERDHLINELKQKAHEFEEYIKTQSNSSGSSSKITKSKDQSVGTSPELDVSTNTKIEAKIRDEMAKIFANELKNIEQRYRLQLTEIEQENQSLQRECFKMGSELNLRQNEVELLKQAILSEREKMQEILKSKDDESEEVMQTQTILLHKSREELKLKQERVAHLMKELTERNDQIRAERESMKAVMTQWEEQRLVVDKNADEWKKTIAELKEDHTSIVDSWRAKYNSAKKTAANYKRYSDDKEAHMLKEYDRLKGEYEASLVKIEIRMRETLDKQIKEMKTKKEYGSEYFPNQKTTNLKDIS